MYKILTALAVVAIAALGTSIIATVLLHSSISRESRQIKALQGAENSDNHRLSALANEVGANKHKKLTAARQRCTHVSQPILAVARPESLFTIRQDSLTAWNALAGIPLSSDTSASGHCG
jgi:hypothetical protein